MDFLFTHISPLDIGRKTHTQWVSQIIPHYAFLQMEQTYTVHKGNCNIHFVCNPIYISDNDFKIVRYCNIHIIDFTRISDTNIFEIVKLGNYCFDLDLVCLLKFPIMSTVMKTYGIRRMLYQENDVAIFMNFNDVQEYFGGITVCGKTTENAILTGLFYCDDIYIVDDIVQFIKECLSNKIHISDYSAINLFHNKTGKLNILPSIPHDTDKHILFDPASYGQYMAGNNQDNRNTFMDANHRIVKEFLGKNRIKIYKENGVYRFDFKENKYSLFNIHIHNKLAIERIINE